MIYLRSFGLSPLKERNPNAYPYNVFKHNIGEVLLFDKITVIYGNNGSGKSTLLNVMANVLGLTGKESLTYSGYTKYGDSYIESCSYTLDEQLAGLGLPKHSMYLKSEDILYQIKKIQQEKVLRESFLFDQAKQGLRPSQLEQIENSYQTSKRIEIMQFANEKYSNGETSMQLFDQYLVPDALYLLDEPETSLSPANQIKLAEEMNSLARHFNCQFVIATHSPFMLGTLDAKIYNLDAPQLKVSEWYELDNVKFFYEFFQKHASKFQ